MVAPVFEPATAGPVTDVPVALPAPTRWFPAAVAVAQLELARARVARVPLLLVATFQSVGILLLLRGVVSTSSEVTGRSVVAGSTVLVVAFVALNLLAQRLGALRAAGGLDRYAALPVPPSAVVLGTVSAYAGFTLPGSVVTALVGSGLYDLPLGRLWILVLVLPLAGAALAGIGALIGLLAPRAELATVAGQLGMSIVLFVGVIPRDRLPEVVRGLRAIVPSAYAVDALADTFRSSVPWGSVAGDLAVCAVVAVAALAAGGWAFRRAVTQR
jgi:ABC-2 type transport system permease protein